MKTNITTTYVNENRDPSGTGRDIDTGIFEEADGGSIPCIQWDDDETGETYRCLIFDGPFSFRRRTFSIEVKKYVQTKGGVWKFSQSYFRADNDQHYTNVMTGESELLPFEDDLTRPIYGDTDNNNDESESITIIGYEQKLKTTSITDAQFFINLAGRNLYGVPVALYDVFIKSVKRYEGLLTE